MAKPAVYEPPALTPDERQGLATVIAKSGSNVLPPPLDMELLRAKLKERASTLRRARRSVGTTISLLMSIAACTSPAHVCHHINRVCRTGLSLSVTKEADWLLSGMLPGQVFVDLG